MRLDSLTLLTRALPTLRTFYREALELPVAEDDAGRLVIEAGHTRLTFEPAPPGWAGFYHFAFNIPAERFTTAKAWLSERAALRRDQAGNDEFDFASWDARALYFDDPAGNIVEFIARRGVNESGAGLIQCVSEIGLVSDDVPALSGILCEQLGIQAYRGAGSDTFAAVGDEQGLFICVRRRREWFPDTGRPAVWADVRAQVTIAEGLRFSLAAGAASAAQLAALPPEAP
jgi:catechol-2,3-dioxygenase